MWWRSMHGDAQVPLAHRRGRGRVWRERLGAAGYHHAHDARPQRARAHGGSPNHARGGGPCHALGECLSHAERECCALVEPRGPAGSLRGSGRRQNRCGAAPGAHAQPVKERRAGGDVEYLEMHAPNRWSRSTPWSAPRSWSARPAWQRVTHRQYSALGLAAMHACCRRKGRAP